MPTLPLPPTSSRTTSTLTCSNCSDTKLATCVACKGVGEQRYDKENGLRGVKRCGPCKGTGKRPCLPCKLAKR